MKEWLFPCNYHCYGSEDDIEETISEGEWLFMLTQSEETERTILELIKAYIKAINSNNKLSQNLINTIKDTPYKSYLRHFSTIP